MKRFIAVIALLAVVFIGSPALAQFAPAPVGTTVDLAPIINPLIQVIGAIILTLGIPLMWMWIGKMLKSWGIEATNELNATRLVVDGIAQKAIGGSITKYAVKPGQITVDVKSEIIADAAKTLVANAGESLTKLGVKDGEQLTKAREMIAARVGLMDAAAAGKPVPDPAQPNVVAAPPAAPVIVESAKTKTAA